MSPLLFHFETNYTTLPEALFRLCQPAVVRAPALLAFNASLAQSLGMEDIDDKGMLAQVFSGNLLPQGATPLAMAYAGHQFGHFVPQLGDGRALLLGEVVDRDGNRRDIQLKGSGQTPFSRRGDGRAAIGPVLREYVVSEAMHRLGIPTTRALAAVATGEMVMRETPLPGAVLTRVAASHLRIGTVEYAATLKHLPTLKALLDYAIARHDPACAKMPQPYVAFLEGVMERQAALVAKWMGVGFIHGVMNTDNMSLSGETIDYGPCAFMDSYHPQTVFSAIDQQGRYAFMHQPLIAQWNLARLAEAMLPLLADEPQQAIAPTEALLSTFRARFEREWLAVMRCKMGLVNAEEGDLALLMALLEMMQQAQADYTLTFRQLAQELALPVQPTPCTHMLGQQPGWQEWCERFRARHARESAPIAQKQERMRLANPLYIPRNHQVEAMITAAMEEGDLAPMQRLLAVLSRPFDEVPGNDAYALPPTAAQRVTRTFCGT